jgi:hypothetical protein
LSGPLMPQAAIERSAALAMKAVRERRNIVAACVAGNGWRKVYHAGEQCPDGE